MPADSRRAPCTLKTADIGGDSRRRKMSGMKTIVRPVFRALPEVVQELLRHPLAPFSRPRKYVNSLIYHLYGYRLFGSPWEGIQLGGGPTPIKSFCNIDASIFCPADVIGRVERLKLPTASAHTIYTSHTLEHLPRFWALPTLREWHRVLRPGGRLYVLVPDLEALCRLYLARLSQYDDPAARTAVDLSRDIMFGGQTNKYDYHYGGYSRPQLSRLLHEAGFSAVEPFDRKALDWAPFRDAGYDAIDDEPVSLNLVATK
jgi:predicted SAM-dependent methyltransferase